MTLIHSLIDHDMLRSDGLYDPWGTGMSVGGAICDVLYVIGESHLIPASAGYSPAAMGNISVDTFRPDPDDDNNEFHQQWTLIQAMNPDEHPGEFVDDMPPVTLDDLVYAMRVIDRYLDIVKLAGRDY